VFDLQLFISAVFGWPLFEGAVVTVLLCAAVQATSLVVSLGTASLATSPRWWVRRLVAAYVWMFRGTPALLVLLFIWNGLPQIFAVFRSAWFSPFLAAFIALTLIQVAYVTEILRSAYAAVGTGQREGAQALGLHRWHVFFYIVLPQALRIATPALVNELISLLKTTSLATVISLTELMTITSLAIATSFKFLEWYSAVLVYYLAMVAALTVVQGHVERMLSKGYSR
jgi:His/Glu/Gln/Arg/opine family amino acid ABC transporter permease subunit